MITKDRKQRVDTMLTEEWGLQLQTPLPLWTGLITLSAFVLVGMVPLLPLFFTTVWTPAQTFAASAMATGIAFLAFGVVRGEVNNRPRLSCALETLRIGGVAAALAEAYHVRCVLHGTMGLRLPGWLQASAADGAE